MLSFNISPLLDIDGKEMGHVVCFSDITRLTELEEQLRRSARLAAMGEMSANLAHEIRNPLGSIKLFASILERNLKDDAESQKLATHIMESVDSLDGSITNMLIYARSPEPDFGKVAIQTVLEESLDTASSAINQGNVTVHRSFDDGRVTVNGDPRFLRQAFSNIMINGVQAMPDGGNLRVSTRIAGWDELQDAGHTILSPKKAAQSYVEVAVADSGQGVEKSEIPRIFEPFFSTKTMGTGLGLSIVKRIVLRHDAFLLVREPHNGGLEFIIALPL